MYYRFLLLSTFLLLISCSQSSLDQPYQSKTYKEDFKEMILDEQVDNHQLYLINYAIMRDRTYIDYSVEGKTYGEILDLAKGFKNKGWPVKETLNPAQEQNILSVSVKNDGIGLMRKGQGSKMAKTLNFSANYQNNSENEVVLRSSTFIIRGPFKDHVATAAFEINCLIPPKEKLEADFIIDAKKISPAFTYKAKPYPAYLMIDSLLTNATIEIGGHTLTKNTRFFETCDLDGSRIEVDSTFSYRKEFEALNPGMDGVLKEVKLGDAHFQLKEIEDPIFIE